MRYPSGVKYIPLSTKTVHGCSQHVIARMSACSMNPAIIGDEALSDNFLKLRDRYRNFASHTFVVDAIHNNCAMSHDVCARYNTVLLKYAVSVRIDTQSKAETVIVICLFKII